MKDNKEEQKKEKKFNHKKDNKELENLKNANAQLNDKLLRVTAEMMNMKRRYEEEISRIHRYEGEDFIEKILEILDNFERAINMDDDNLNDEVSKFLSGFKLIYGNLRNYLDEIEVKEIECINKPFNEEEMEAVLTEKVDDKEPNVVIEVMQKGYKYKDKVIRHAMVKVSE